MNRASLEIVEQMPKVEMHVHLEGSVTPGLLLDLHRRHGLAWKNYTEEEVAAALAFSDFHGFLAAFRKVCEAIRAPDDFAIITRRFFERLSRENIIHCEFFYTPAASRRFGLPPEHVLETILGVAKEEGDNRNIGWGVVLDGIRQFPADDFAETVDLAVKYRAGGVVAIGMGGDEMAAPLAPMKRYFDRARDAGLNIHLHTGETGSADGMTADIRAARPNRIGHGLQVLESELLQELVLERGIILDLAITSNLRTGVVRRLDRHPAAEIARQGIPFTLATDDPGLFDTTLASEYRHFIELRGDSRGLSEIVRWSAETPRLSESHRRSLRQLMDMAR